jgi:hypothetical protein
MFRVGDSWFEIVCDADQNTFSNVIGSLPPTTREPRRNVEREGAGTFLAEWTVGSASGFPALLQETCQRLPAVRRY